MHLNWSDLTYNGSPAVLRALETIQKALTEMEQHQARPAEAQNQISARLTTAEYVLSEELLTTAETVLSRAPATAPPAVSSPIAATCTIADSYENNGWVHQYVAAVEQPL